MNIAIISGASRGIGRAIAAEIDRENLDQLWFISRSYEDKGDFKTPVRHFSLDLSSPSFTDAIKSALTESGCKIKYLVCSAGVGYTGKLEELTEEEIENTVALNCTALSLLTKICIPYMEKGGKILEIASGAGFLPQPLFSAYAASKAYVISLSRALRTELKEREINVTAVCPGPVDTDFFKELDPPEYKKKYVISAEKVAKKAIKSVKKNKAVCSTSLSIKLVHFISKLIPTSFILKFYK